MHERNISAEILNSLSRILLLKMFVFLLRMHIFFQMAAAFLFTTIRTTGCCSKNSGSTFPITQNVAAVVDNHPRSPMFYSSPLIDYDTWIDNKLEDADSKPVAAVPFSSSIFDERKSSWEVPMIDFLDIIQLSLAASRSNECASKRQSLAQRIASHGGYCIVRLPSSLDEWERRVISTMWKSMYQLLDHNINSKHGDKYLRHQTLTRSSDEEAHQTSGYKFIQTNLQNSAAISPAFQDAFVLLSLLAKAFTVICYSAIHDPYNPAKATHRIDTILDEYFEMDNDTSPQEDQSSKILRRPMAGTYHRLCRYVENTGECLRSHADWTCATSIPVSKVPGLEIYDAQIQAWIQPENILTANNDDDVENDEHTKYIVVMSGKWLELLTGGAIASCLHRVVGNAKTQTRFSAPLFLRPKESLFAQLENLRYKHEKDENDDMRRTRVSTKQKNDCVQFIFNSMHDKSSADTATLSSQR